MSKASPRTRIRIKRAPLLAAVAMPVILAGTWWGFTAPRVNDASALQEQAAAAQAGLTVKQQRLADITRDGNAQADTLLEVARYLDSQLPQQTSAARLAARLETLAKETGVTIGSLTAQTEPVVVGSGQAAVFTLELQGTGPQVLEFLSGLQSFTPVTSAHGTTFTLSDTEPPVTANATVYVWTSTTPELGTQSAAPETAPESVAAPAPSTTPDGG